jgi:hypothetical protein
MTSDFRNGRHLADLSATDFYQLTIDRTRVGTPRVAIQQELVARGIEPDAAKLILDNVEKTRRRQQQSTGRRNIIFGAVACVAGAAATAVTYFTAEPGGYYYIFWAAGIFGAVQLIWGVFQYSTAWSGSLR